MVQTKEELKREYWAKGNLEGKKEIILNIENQIKNMYHNKIDTVKQAHDNMAYSDILDIIKKFKESIK